MKIITRDGREIEYSDYVKMKGPDRGRSWLDVLSGKKFEGFPDEPEKKPAEKPKTTPKMRSRKLKK